MPWVLRLDDERHVDTLIEVLKSERDCARDVVSDPGHEPEDDQYLADLSALLEAIGPQLNEAVGYPHTECGTCGESFAELDHIKHRSCC